MMTPSPAAKIKFRPGELYFVLDGLDFTWFPAEVADVREAWDKGLHIVDMAEMFGRPTEEVFLLLMDLTIKGKINERQGGIFGRGLHG